MEQSNATPQAAGRELSVLELADIREWRTLAAKYFRPNTVDPLTTEERARWSELTKVFGPDDNPLDMLLSHSDALAARLAQAEARCAELTEQLAIPIEDEVPPMTPGLPFRLSIMVEQIGGYGVTVHYDYDDPDKLLNVPDEPCGKAVRLAALGVVEGVWNDDPAERRAPDAPAESIYDAVFRAVTPDAPEPSEPSRCWQCGGRGYMRDTPASTCRHCNGKGRV
jgi:hypothetical protein